MDALGSIEVCGYSTALLIVNKLYQYTDIQVVNLNFNKPANAELDKIPLQVQIEFTGDVDQLKEALILGKEEALKYNNEDDIIIHMIPNPYIKINELEI